MGMERTPAEMVLFALSYYPFPLLLIGVVTGTWWLIAGGLTMSAIGLTGFWIRENRDRR